MEYEPYENNPSQERPEKIWEKDETIGRYIKSILFQSIVLMQKNVLSIKGKIIPSLSRLLTPAIFFVGLFIIQYVFRTETLYEETKLKFDEPDYHLYVGYQRGSLNKSEVAHGIDIINRLAQNNNMTIQAPDAKGECEKNICFLEFNPLDSEEIRSYITTTDKFSTNTYGLIALGPQNRRDGQGYPYMGKKSLNVDFFTNGTKFSRNPYIVDPNAGTLLDYYIPMIREYSKAETELAQDTNNIIDVNFNVYKGSNGNNANTTTDFVLHALIGMVIFIALYFTNISTHYDLNDEFHNELRENMDMMGLKRTSYWISTVCHHGAFCVFGTLMMIGLGYAFQWNFFMKCNFVIIFCVFFAINFSIFTNFLCLSRCCRSSRGSYCWNFFVFVVVLCMIFPFAPLTPRTDLGFYVAPTGYFLYIAGNGAIAVNLIIPINYGKILSDISYFTQDIYSISQNKWIDNPNGYSFSDFFKKRVPIMDIGNGATTAPENYINFLFILLHIAFNIVCTWYLDHVMPTKNGNRKPLWFFFLPSYWCKQRISSRSGLAVDVVAHQEGKFSSILPSTDKDIYREYQSVIKSLDTDIHHEDMPLKILDFNKTYSSILGSHSRNTTAVSNLTLGGERGQVLVLLGHNGAGKTTTIKMLTGLCAPSGGDAVIFGHSVVNQIESVRRSMGVVLQHDILFPELSAYQHMRLFCLLKGIPISMLKKEIESKLKTVKLWKFRKQLAKTFSGGMKRRLSVAISIIGDPKIIFMDEPSSGMDVYSKRHIWDLVARLKKDRMIVLTTHAMEEAEAMGDKIAIMALGQLRAIGSIVHLKQRYGAGYSIDMITKKPNELKEKVSTICPKANMETEASGILTYSLKQANRKHILDLLKYLEAEASLAKSNREKVLVQDFLMSYTTLSEVFLRITHGGNMDADNFADQGANAAHNGQLNVLIENQSEALGFIEVDSQTTLDGVRQLISRYIDDVPPYYCFLSKGVRLPFRYEPAKFAMDFLPLIVLRPISEDEAMGKKPISQPSTTTSSTVPNMEIERLHEELQKRDDIINQLRAQIAALQQQMPPSAPQSDDNQKLDTDTKQ